MEFIYFGLGLICSVDQLKIGLNYKKALSPGKVFGLVKKYTAKILQAS